ncbi:unnamed protein product [Didymodactylos carnosus]|uniref:Uncharacterized protein n=1 Tax=Didymodactylos carnosus TaxID=1234261 RepID=A0A8S2ZB24_9BILA|nr:unnamed protein product [Didymodactylos carnosus]
MFDSIFEINILLLYTILIASFEIFLIVSATIGQLFVHTIHELTQIKCIYILCQHNRQQLTKWTADYSKTMNHIYTHVDPLINILKIDLYKCRKTLLNYKIENSIIDVQFKTADFKWSRLLAQTLVRLPREEKAKNEMIKNLKEN